MNYCDCGSCCETCGHEPGCTLLEIRNASSNDQEE